MSSPEQEAVPGRTLGRYSLLCRLAAGGMGEVYLGSLQSMEGVSKPFAIKVLLPQMAQREDIVSMFITEARVASRMTHPNVCQVFELGVEEEQLFICMEYLEGVPLSSIFKQHTPSSPLPIRLALALIQQACAGFHYAHELKDERGTPLGVVHRDVSPSNLFITSAGVLKILDFGIVKANDSNNNTRTGLLKGKFCYMAPEHIKGKTIDNRADIFSLGVVLHELLTNRPLFSRSSEYEAIRGITELPIRPIGRADLPKGLEAVVMKALCRDLDGRYATMKDFRNALTPIADSLGGALPTEDVANYVQSTFADPLLERQEAINAATDSARLRLLEPVASLDTPTVIADNVAAAAAKGKSTSQSGGFGPETATIPASLTDLVANREFSTKRSSSTFLSIMAVAGVAALVVVAVLLYLQSRETPVAGIVFEGKLTPVNGASAAGSKAQADAAQTDLHDASDSIDAPDAAPQQGATNRTGNSSNSGKSRSGCAALETLEARNRCHIGAKKGAFIRCLKENSAAVARPQALNLAFDVSASGVIESVSLSPALPDALPLEACIKRVVKSIRLGPQGAKVRLQIPVKVSR